MSYDIIYDLYIIIMRTDHLNNGFVNFWVASSEFRWGLSGSEMSAGVTLQRFSAVANRFDLESIFGPFL